jgi:3-oxoacyl-[acyl-carrier-protein] synthase II
VLDLDAEHRIPPRALKRSARFTQLALVAAFECLEDSGLEAGAARENVAVVAGSGIGGFEFLNREHEVFLSRGPGRFHPLTVPIIIPNMAAGAIAMETECRGPNLCVTTACASGASSIGTALDLLRCGRCDVAIAGGAESTISACAVDGYCQLRALSTRNDTPTTASRPLSADRDGFVLAEGAAFLLLETEAHARAREGLRGAAGLRRDGRRLSPDRARSRGPRARRAMQAALADAHIAPDEVDAVNAHVGRHSNDVTPRPRDPRRVRGARGPPISIDQVQTGHSLGAASAIEAVASVLTIQHGIVHPTINLHQADPECDLDYVPLTAREAHVRVVASNAFGFGGHNAVLVFRAAG